MFKKALFAAAFAAVTLISCGDDDNSTPQTPIEANATLIQNIKVNYANIAFAGYEDSYKAAMELQTKINEFVATPTEARFEAAKQAWYDAREPYGQTEAFRFANGPIDTGADAKEGALNAWPLDESYIDYVNHSGESNTNIINDTATFPTITKEVLVGANEGGNEERNVSVGYHAIEFLLWGQDTTTPVNGAEHTTGGKRPYTDYVTDGTGTHANQDRRGTFLKLCAEILVEDLKTLVDAWDNNGSNYRTTFLALDNSEALTNILSGASILIGAELATERMFVALDQSSQEDEHSCFSDNTHRDIRLNFYGVENVYKGSYTRTNDSVVSGASISELIAKTNSTLNTETLADFAAAKTKVEATGIPFDYAIFNNAERVKIDAAIIALQDLGKKIALDGADLGLTVGTELP